MNDKRERITVKAAIIGALLIIPNNYWMTQMEMVWGGTYPSVITLLFNVVFTLFLLITINSALRRFLPQFSLNRSELLVIYVMLAVGCSLNGTDVMQTLVYIVGTGDWYTTPENEWGELFGQHLPRWLTIGDKKVLTGFFEGESTFYVWENVKAWLTPIAMWCAFTLALVWVMLCINVILRRQWIESERLAYPIVVLPFEMTEGGGASGLFKNRRMWIGFGIAAAINIINGISYLYPQIPMIPVKRYWIYRYFTDKPWNAISGWITVSFYPFVIGLGFLMPLDMSLSAWFFFLFWQFERIVGAMLGWRSMPGFPYPVEQLSGIWLGLLVFALWAGRKHFREVFARVLGLNSQVVKRAVGSQVERAAGSLKVEQASSLPVERVASSQFDESGEPMRYRTAVLGIIGGIAFITLFCAKAGMSLWAVFAYFGIYLALSTTLARIRAELGPPAHDMYGSGPDVILYNLLGTKRIGRNNLTIMTLFYWLNREACRSHTMPHQLEGFKLAERARLNTRRLSRVMMIAALVGMISAFWVALHPAYKIGAQTRFGGPAKWFALEGFNRLGWWSSYSTGANKTAFGFMGFGFIFTLAVLLMRMRFIWWRLHPVGYAISTWWAINQIWFPIFIAFVIKSLIFKYAGLKAYQKAVPFFLGLILGEFVVGGFWSILGIILGRRMYAFWV